MICSASPIDNVQARYSRADFDHSPLIVFYEVTQACDLVCQHCRACAQSQPHPGELSSAESRQLISQLAEFPKPPMLVLTGGDPLKRPDICEMVEHGVRMGLEVSITPSATPLVTGVALRQLRDAGISRVAVSLDGANAATHDAFRGVPGSFDRTLHILSSARAGQIPLQVNTTITTTNFHQIDALADLLADQRIAMWSVFFLVPVGRAAYRQRLSAEQCEKAFEKLWQQSRRQPYAIKTTEAPHYRRYVLQKQRCESGGERSTDPRCFGNRFAPLGVNDGKGVMFVGHTGLIYPSGFMPIVCGLFPLEHIVRVYQHSPILSGLRDVDRLEGKCRACEYRHICGGSRARAYAVTGNIYAQEPDCAYIPAALP
jgi:radical SAM protein